MQTMIMKEGGFDLGTCVELVSSTSFLFSGRTSEPQVMGSNNPTQFVSSLYTTTVLV
jgi:hypothetical protein